MYLSRYISSSGGSRKLGNLLPSSSHKEQSNRIRDIRAQIMKLGLDDWMCEGADDNAIILFNNKEDKSICVDYISGKVLYAHTYNHNDDLGSFELTPELRQLVRLESEIARICY